MTMARSVAPKLAKVSPECCHEEKKQPRRRHDGSEQLRACRLLSMVSAYGVLLGIGALTSGLSRITVSEEFSTSDLDVVVSGCDVKIVSGRRNRIRVTRWLWDWALMKRGYARGTKLKSLAVRNHVGCHNPPRFACRHICHVKIKVNDAPSALRITEEASDNSDRMRIQVSGVALNSLAIRGNFDVDMANAMIAGDLAVRSTSGDLRFLDSVYGENAAAFLLSSEGSIYLVEASEFHAVDLLYRATMRKVCVLYDGSLSHEQPDCSVDRAWRHFDADANGRTTQTEFAKGLESLDKCIGDGCPHYTLPLTLQSTVFDSGQGDGSSLVQLPNLDFTASLLKQNLTELFPFCYSKLAYTSSGGNRNRSLTVDLRAGEFRMDISGTETWQPDGGLPGIRMLQRDAEMLASKLRAYTNPVNTANERFVFAILDVDPGVGIPGDRWLYASNDVYLELNPALLEMLSFTFLAPRIARYRIRFTNGDACANVTSDARRAVYEEIRHALMDRFQVFLKGDLVRVKKRNWFVPYSTNLEAYRAIDGTFEAFDYERTAPGTGRTAFYVSFLLAIVAAVFLMVRFMQAMIAVRRQVQTVDDMQRRMTKRNALISRTTLVYKPPPGGQPARDNDEVPPPPAGAQSASCRDRLLSRWVVLQKKLLSLMKNKDDVITEDDASDASSVGSEEDQQQPTKKRWRFSEMPRKYRFLLELAEPFVRPIAVIDSIILIPLTRFFVDPMATFVKMRCVLDLSEARSRMVAAKGATFESSDEVHAVTLEVFMQAHRAFCFQRKLRAVSGRANLQNAIIRQFNLRLKRRDLPYLNGVRWKTDSEFRKLRKDERVFVDIDRYCAEAREFFACDDTACEPQDKEDDRALEKLLELFLNEQTEIETGIAKNRARIAICDTGVFMFDGAFGAQVGLARAFTEWRARRKGEDDEVTTTMSQTQLCRFRRALKSLALKRHASVTKVTKLVVEGVRLRNFEAGGRLEDLPPNFYFFTCLIVWLHTFCLVVWPIGLCVYAVELQIKYCKFAANVRDEHWLSAYDYGKPGAWMKILRSTKFVFIAKYLIHSSWASVLAAMIRQYVHYASDDPLPSEKTVVIDDNFFTASRRRRHHHHHHHHCDPPKVEEKEDWTTRGRELWSSSKKLIFQSARILCFVSSVLTFLNVMTFFLVSCLWILAAAVIDPTEYLRYTAAAATLVMVTVTMARELALAAVVFQSRYLRSIRERVVKTLRGMAATTTSVDSAVDDDVDRLFLDAEEKAQPTLSDAELAFRALDVQNKKTVAFDDVVSIVDFLQIGGLDAAKVDQIFAHADRNLDERLSLEEFEAAWDWLMEEIVSSALHKAGLGPSAIVATLLVAVALMLGTFAFIFLVVAAFTESRTFSAIVESGLVALSGVSVKRYWSSSDAVVVVSEKDEDDSSANNNNNPPDEQPKSKTI